MNSNAISFESLLLSTVPSVTTKIKHARIVNALVAVVEHGLTSSQAVKSVIANTTVPNSVISLLTSSVVSVETQGIWQEIAPTANAAQTGATDPPTVHLALQLVALVAGMPWIASTNSLCRNYLVVHLVVGQLNA